MTANSPDPKVKGTQAEVLNCHGANGQPVCVSGKDKQLTQHWIWWLAVHKWTSKLNSFSNFSPVTIYYVWYLLPLNPRTHSAGQACSLPMTTTLELHGSPCPIVGSVAHIHAFSQSRKTLHDCDLPSTSSDLLTTLYNLSSVCWVTIVLSPFMHSQDRHLHVLPSGSTRIIPLNPSLMHKEVCSTLTLSLSIDFYFM